MATEEGVQRVVFDSVAAAAMVEELRSYRSGKTMSYEWRVSQLQKLEKITEFHEQEIVEALRSDLSKPEFESFVQEDCQVSCIGESEMGAYHGKFSFEAFSHKKAVVYRGFFGDASVRYPPYTNGKLNLLKALVGGSILGIIRALFRSSKA